MCALKVGVIGVGGIARTHMPGWEASHPCRSRGGRGCRARGVAKAGASITASASWRPIRPRSSTIRISTLLMSARRICTMRP